MTIPAGASRTAAGAAVIVVVVGSVFSRSLSFDFVNFDDPIHVTNNRIVQSAALGDQIRYAFTTTDDGNYIPLSWLTHIAVARTFGLNPAAHHLVNVILHAIAAALFFVFLARATGRSELALIATLLFALHPLRVESIAWVAERKDVLCAVFWMAALVAYERYVRQPTRARYAVVGFLFVAALLSKSMAVTLPCVLLLLDAWPFARSGWRQLVAEKLPLFLCSAAIAVVTVFSQGSTGTLHDIGSLPVGTRVLNAFAGYGAYVIQTVWPTGLAVYYPAMEAPALYGAAALGATLLGMITATAVVVWKGAPYVLTGWLWFLGVLVPVSGLMQVGGQAHADRYTYLPHAGLFIALVWSADALGRRIHMPRRVWQAAAATVCLFLAVATWNQLGYWRSSKALFGQTLAVTEKNRVAEVNYALALATEGDLETAARHLRKAAAIGPPKWKTYHNLGRVLMQGGKLEEAEPALTQAVALDPDKASTWYLLGNVRLRLDRPAAAVDAFERAVALDPTLVSAQTNLAVALGEMGRFDDASDAFVSAILAHPEDAGIRHNYGVLLLKTDRYTTGIDQLQLAAELDPTHVESRYALAVVFAGRGATDAAFRFLGEAIALDASVAPRARDDGRLKALRDDPRFEALVGS